VELGGGEMTDKGRQSHLDQDKNGLQEKKAWNTKEKIQMGAPGEVIAERKALGHQKRTPTREKGVFAHRRKRRIENLGQKRIKR